MGKNFAYTTSSWAGNFSPTAAKTISSHSRCTIAEGSIDDDDDDRMSHFPPAELAGSSQMGAMEWRNIRSVIRAAWSSLTLVNEDSMLLK